MKKKLVCITLLCVMCFISACGKDTQDNTSAENTTNAVEDQEENSTTTQVKEDTDTESMNTTASLSKETVTEGSVLLIEKEALIKKEDGQQVVLVEYPVYSVLNSADSGMESRLSVLNTDAKNAAEDEYDYLEEQYKSLGSDAGLLSYTIENAEETFASDRVVSFSITTMEEAGGPHPNNYSVEYVLSRSTGDDMDYKDILNLSDDLYEFAAKQLISDYPELSDELGDETSLKAKIGEALEAENSVKMRLYSTSTGYFDTDTLVLDLLDSGIIENTTYVPDLGVCFSFENDAEYFQ